MKHTTGGQITAVKGGHRWQSAVVCPGTTIGWHSTPAFSQVPVDLQADCHRCHANTHMQGCCHAYISVLHPRGSSEINNYSFLSK